MRIIDRHITTSIISIFLITFIVFCVLYLVIDITNQLDEFIDRKIPVNILIQYYIFYFPVILIQTSSFACLISSVFTYSALNNSNEIIAMRSCGLSFWQIAKPALIFALIISTLVFWLNEKYVPTAMSEANKIRDNYMVLASDREQKKQEHLKNLTLYGLKNRLYFIDTFNAATYDLEGITIIENDPEQNIRQKIVALKGVWTGIAWKFYQCQITEFDPLDINRPLKIKVFDEKLMDIKETPKDFLKQKLDVASMNISQLNNYIERFSNSGATKALNNLKVDLHQKIAYPFGNFVIVLIGLPFALMVKSRKGFTFTAMGLAIGIGFLYYVANAVALALGKGGALPPILSAWAAPLVFITIALIVIENNF